MPTDKKRIQAYVSLSTYESLKDKAESRSISISELVGEILQTQSTTVTDSNSSRSNLSSLDDSFVTKEQLSFILQEFGRDIERTIIREVNKAEAHWEANANVIASMNHSFAKLLYDSESSKKASSGFKKKKG